MGDGTEQTGYAGTTLGSYRILGEIGRGGMGVVYKAFDPQLKRTVALKVLTAGEDASQEAVSRFRREAEAVAKLGHHPNIVPVYDVGHVEHEPDPGTGHVSSRHFIAMHYVEGSPLDRLMDEIGLTPREAAGIAHKTAGALAHAHAHGILHRDVKPANILLPVSSRETKAPDFDPENKDWEPMLTDFGLARDVACETRMTRSGAIVGTPQYMPPEQAEGRLDDVDERSDVYSLGATLYEMLVLHPPFEGATALDVARKVIRYDPLSPCKSNPAVDRSLATICMKCLEKDPKKRYPSAEALRDDLGLYLEGRSISARPPSLSEKIVRRIRRNKALTASLASSFFVLAILALLAIYSQLGLSREREEGEKAVDRKIEASDRARDAESILDKGRAVSEVIRKVQSELGEVVRELKRNHYRSHSREGHLAAVAAIWPKVEAFEKGLPGDPASRAAWLAVKGWLRVFAGRWEDAVGLFAEARKTDPDIPHGHLFEAMLRLWSYFRNFPMPAVGRDQKGFTVSRAPEESPKAREHREKLEEHLSAVRQSPLWGKSSSEAVAGILEGVRALQKGRFPELETALTRSLGLPEFHVLVEEIREIRGLVRYWRGDLDGAMEDFQHLRETLPEYGQGHLLSGTVLEARAYLVEQEGGDPRDLYGRAIAEYDKGISLSPRRADMYQRRGVAYKFLATVILKARESPLPLLEKAEADLRRGTELNPQFPLDMDLGDVLVSKSLYHRDPLPLLREAVRLFTAVKKRKPDKYDCYLRRGGAYVLLGEILAENGMDPMEAFKGAEGDFTECMKMNPGKGWPHLQRGKARLEIGRTLRLRREDPRDDLEAAILDLSRGLELGPPSHLAHLDRSEAYMDLAEAKARAGEDPFPDLARAEADGLAADSLRPGNPSSFIHLGNVYMETAFASWMRGRDGHGPAAKALEAFDRVIKLDPAFHPAWRTKGSILRSLGRFEDSAKCYAMALRLAGPGADELTEVLGELRRILKSPGWVGGLARGESAYYRSEFQAARKLLEEGLAAAEKGEPQDRTAYSVDEARAHFLLSCILAQASDGYRAPLSEPVFVDPKEKSDLVRSALAHLRMAKEKGLPDFGKEIEEIDLDPLRGLPEFRELAGR